MNFELFYIGLDGSPVKRNPFDYPYSYDCYIVWMSDEFDYGHNLLESGLTIVYSDRLIQWDYEKFYQLCQKI